jgi:hypothetical protein
MGDSISRASNTTGCRVKRAVVSLWWGFGPAFLPKEEIMEFELDYSEIKTPVQSIQAQEDWEPPVHKFFGKKLPGGKTEKEPVYVHQEYPRAMYRLQDKRIVVKVVHSDIERDSLGEGWEKSFAAFGHISAPSFEQRLAMEAIKAAELKEKQEDAQDVVDSFVETLKTAPKRGRPAKA